MPTPSRSPTATAGAAIAIALAICTVLLGGCASIANVRQGDAVSAEAASQARPNTRSVAQGVEVMGRHGRLDAAARTQLLQGLGNQGNASALNRQVQAMARFGDVDLYAGNEAQLLMDGPVTFAAMFQAIAQARHSVLLQSYIIEDQGVAAQLAALLARKRAEGVRVLVLYDALGSIGTPAAYFEALHSADVPTCAFNPVNPLQRLGYWGINHRDHRKILVVDRAVGFTGGINISTVYGSGSFGRQRRLPPDSVQNGWRDTQIRLRGPAVAALEDLVRSTWLTQGCMGALPSLAPLQPAIQAGPAGQQLVRVVASTPDEEQSRIYAMLVNAIDVASKSVYLTMAYFAPGQELVDALCDAARRGVDVQLVLPGKSDFAPVLHAGRDHYARLLAAGVKLFELQDAVLHAKSAVIDGVLSTVGSSNLDWRSIALNSEVNVVLLGEDFGDAMQRMFRQDLANSHAITPAAWAERPLADRVKQTLAGLVERLL